MILLSALDVKNSFWDLRYIYRVTFPWIWCFLCRILVMCKQLPLKCWSPMCSMNRLWLMLHDFLLLLLRLFSWYGFNQIALSPFSPPKKEEILSVYRKFMSSVWLIAFGSVQQGTKRMPGTAVTKSVVANERGGRKREEIFVDIIEKISVTFSSSVST